VAQVVSEHRPAGALALSGGDGVGAAVVRLRRIPAQPAHDEDVQLAVAVQIGDDRRVADLIRLAVVGR
jgi:hypothetical protein